jgi:hypothetical protein
VIDPEYDPDPRYSCVYSVHDPVIWDVKEQLESRSGDVVQGSYSLVEPDGTVRTVEYTADIVSGFNAVIERHPLVVRAVAPHAFTPFTYPLHTAHANFDSPYASYVV